MTRFRRNRLYRVVAQLVAISFLAPFLEMGFVLPVHAQLGQTMTIGLVDFTNRSGVLGDALSRMASGAVYVELNKSRRFDVITDTQMKAVMSDLGMKPPLTSVDTLRLGSELESDAMLEGDITAVKISKEPPQVSVTLALRMIDVASGELLNGAVVTGTSSPRVGLSADTDTLAAEAINYAAYLAVKTMVEYIIPEATVQNTIGTNEVLLNKGSRDGIHKGMRLVVLRDKAGGGREVVGRIRVAHANPNDAVAIVISAPKGVKPEDKVRAIYEMPGYKSPAEATTAKIETTTSPTAYAKKGGFKNLLTTLLVVLGLATLIKPSGHGAESVGTVVAEAGFPPDIKTGSPGVQARFNPSKLAGGKNVLQWKLWRDSVVVDTVDGTAARMGYLFDAGTPSGTYSEPDPTSPTTLRSVDISAPALIPGDTHSYFVTAVYQVTLPGTTSKIYYETDPSYAGVATLVARTTGLIASTKGQSDVDLRAVDFSWTSMKGADEYIVEATTENDQRFRNPRYISATKTWVGTENVTLLLEDQNISALFRDLKTNDKILWRVGARSSADKPGPVPSPKRRFIYSQTATITVSEQPPPPPG